MNIQDLFADIAIIGIVFDLTDRRAGTQNRSGTLRPTSSGERFWFGEVTLQPVYPRLADRLSARVRRLTDGDASFQISPATCYGKTISVGTIVTIDNDDRRLATLGGDGATLDEGDWFGVEDQNGRKNIHSVFTRTGTQLEFTPPLNLAAQIGDTTTYGFPHINATVTPGSAQPLMFTGSGIEGMSFSWFQDRESSS